MLKWTATLMLVLAPVMAWAEDPAPADAPKPDAPAAVEPKAEGEAATAPAETVEPEAFDLDQLLAMVREFDATLYAAQQDKLAGQITGKLVMHGETLLEKFRAEKDPPVDLVRLLGFARTDDAKAELRKLLDSPDGSRRAAAAFALGVAQDSESLPRLMKLLDDSDAKVARQAAMAVGRMRDKTCYETIEKRLDSKDPLMRLAAIKALGLMGDDRAQARLEDYLRTHDDPIETVAVLDALNLIAGDNLFRIIEQFDRVAGALEKHGTGRQTQLAQAAVTDSLERLIKKAEDDAQKKGGGGGGTKRQTSAQGQPMSGSGTGKSQGGASPASQSHNNPGDQVDAQLAEIQRTAGAVWGNLPPAVQEEVTAALKQELPERYQHLLRIYYKILAEGK